MRLTSLDISGRTPGLPGWVKRRGATFSIAHEWPAQIFAARRADDLAAVVDQAAPQEGGFHATGQLDALEGRIALMRFRLRGAHDKACMRVDKDNIGVEAWRDIALAMEAEALRR